MMGCVMLFIRPRELAVSLPMLSSRKQCEEAMRCGGVYTQVCCKLSSQNMHFAPPICHISHPLPWLHITVSVILMYYRNVKLRRSFIIRLNAERGVFPCKRTICFGAKREGLNNVFFLPLFFRKDTPANCSRRTWACWWSTRTPWMWVSGWRVYVYLKKQLHLAICNASSARRWNDMTADRSLQPHGTRKHVTSFPGCRSSEQLQIAFWVFIQGAHRLILSSLSQSFTCSLSHSLSHFLSCSCISCISLLRNTVGSKSLRPV